MTAYHFQHFWRKAHIAQNGYADERMLVNGLEFFVGELPGLVQDGVCHADFADVVQQRALAEQAQFAWRELHLLGDFHAVVRHARGMALCVTIFGF